MFMSINVYILDSMQHEVAGYPDTRSPFVCFIFPSIPCSYHLIPLHVPFIGSFVLRGDDGQSRTVAFLLNDTDVKSMYITC
jgi:hypothetical protein